jgi:hypothetical protein
VSFSIAIQTADKIKVAKALLDTIAEYTEGSIPIDVIIECLGSAITSAARLKDTHRLYIVGELATEFGCESWKINNILLSQGVVRQEPRNNRKGYVFKPQNAYVNGGYAVIKIDSDEKHPQTLWIIKGRDLIFDLLNN